MTCAPTPVTFRLLDDVVGWDAALVRNLWRGKEPPAAGLAHVMARVAAQRAALAATPVDTLVVAERLPE